MTQRVLVLNAGSSSLKYRLLDGATGVPEASGTVERIGEETGTLTHSVGGEEHEEKRRVADFEDALRSALGAFDRHGPAIDRDTLAAVGHRVVHGGDLFAEPVVVDDRLLATVARLDVSPLGAGALAGSSLPLMVLMVADNGSLAAVVPTQVVAQEIVRSAVATIGLIAAVPLTTALTAWALRSTGADGPGD